MQEKVEDFHHQADRKISTTLYRMRSGHNRFNVHLNRIYDDKDLYAGLAAKSWKTPITPFCTVENMKNTV